MILNRFANGSFQNNTFTSLMLKRRFHIKKKIFISTTHTSYKRHGFGHDHHHPPNIANEEDNTTKKEGEKITIYGLIVNSGLSIGKGFAGVVKK